uniref:Ska2 N-terminal domain-containing protein n=1 Tax=Fagus sylvatica TaxID=28930 RepID=A0A2N9GCL9_FAGSY
MRISSKSNQKAKQDLIDKALTTLGGNRTFLQQMQASVGIPLISDSDDPAFANFNKIVDEWEAQVRSRTSNWMQTKKRTTLVLPGVTFLHIKEYGHSNHCLLWPSATRLWCHLRLHGPRCSSTTPDNNHTKTKTKTPQILKLTVSGVTELLRLFSSNQTRLERESDKEREEIAVSGIDDVVIILKSDYENSYFVTGVFTSAIYAEDCIFEDPTIRFRGKELYSRNLKLLVPFFDCPSIGLQKIEKVVILYVKFDFISNNGMVGYLHINRVSG